MRRIYIIAAFFAAAVLCSCSKNDIRTRETADKGSLSVNAAMSAETDVRANVAAPAGAVEHCNLVSNSGKSIRATMTSRAWTDNTVGVTKATVANSMTDYADIAFACLSEDFSQTYIDLQPFTNLGPAGNDGRCIFMPEIPFFLPDEEAAYNYMAYAPAGVPGLDVTLAGPATTLDYTIPKDLKKQVDLAKAYNFGVYGTEVRLTFTHALAALVFKKGTILNPELEIEEIRVSGIADHAVYSVVGIDDHGAPVWAWSGQESKDPTTDFVLTFDETHPFSAEGDAIFVLPQSFSSEHFADAEITVVTNLLEDGSPLTYSMKLAPELGHRYWYDSNIYEYVISIDAPDPNIEPFCFTAAGEQSVRFVKYNTEYETESAADANLAYSYDKHLWHSWDDPSSALTFGTADKPALYIIGNNPEGLTDNDITLVEGTPKMVNYDMFAFGSKSTAVNVSGNIITLVNYKEELNSFPSSVTKPFVGLFRGAPISDASGLKLDSDSLMPFAYYGMFMQNTKLQKTPELGSPTMADYCYGQMFFACTSLQAAPELPATELADYCYTQMFVSDIFLSSAPELPAESLAEGCYKGMFYYCVSIVSAPVLPAASLEKECYCGMFQYCQSLSSITMLATDISAEDCLLDWVDHVSATGTFRKAPSMMALPSGTCGIPEGWAVEYATE